MKTKLLLTLGASLLLMSTATAQVFFQSTMYTYQQYVYNPAVTGLNEFDLKPGATLSLFGRLQWAGIDGAPETSALSFHSPLPNPGAGSIGLIAAVDRLGSISNTWVQASYAYETELSGRLKFRAGIAGGVKQAAINIDPVYNTDNGIDPIIVNQAGVTVNIVNAGLHLSNMTDSTDGFFVSLAGQNLLEPSIDGLTLPDAGGILSTVGRTFSLAGGYRFRLGENDKMFLQPSVMMMTDFVDLPQASVSVLWSYSPLVIGLNYRMNSSESVGAMLGVNVTNNLFLGYAYDYPAGPLNGNFDINTHELVLTYSFGDIWRGSNRNDGKNVDILFDGDGL